MNYKKTTVLGEQKNILANTHYTAINKKVAKTIATDGVIAAGTVINKSGTVIAANAESAANALGVVLYDVDVKNEKGTNVAIPVVTHASIIEAATELTYSTAVKAALPQILFV